MYFEMYFLDLLCTLKKLSKLYLFFSR